MHGNINTRDRYTACLACGDSRSFDTVIQKCTITSCPDYFGTKPFAADARHIVEEVRGMPDPDIHDRATCAICTAVDAYRASKAPPPPFVGEGEWFPARNPAPRPPSTREVVEAERAVLNVAIAWHAAGRDSWTYLEDLHGRVKRLNALLARNSASNSDAFSRQHDR